MSSENGNWESWSGNWFKVRLAGCPDDPCVREQAALLASAQDDLPLTTAAQRLISLLARHQAEWSRFLAEETSDGSWARALCE